MLVIVIRQTKNSKQPTGHARGLDRGMLSAKRQGGRKERCSRKALPNEGTLSSSQQNSACWLQEHRNTVRTSPPARPVFVSEKVSEKKKLRLLWRRIRENARGEKELGCGLLNSKIFEIEPDSGRCQFATQEGNFIITRHFVSSRTRRRKRAASESSSPSCMVADFAAERWTSSDLSKLIVVQTTEETTSNPRPRPECLHRERSVRIAVVDVLSSRKRDQRESC